ncbi:hypothetical protein PMZ73_13360 [[Clostridium] symbiosum]|uniref:hypothetical protein n=1 Tax=Clostridium symbiosum TaxID=1512 RepID=UPI00233029E6|nr:hypothetical protein [[Clostridium] symbiosum]MDB1977884.1 hypothetical protein [[Clostridium] symbiosum]MDB1983134.1 hypothetical protein [[Clostridium] symbiosum]
MVRNCASGIGLPDRNIAITKGHCGRIGLHYKMASFEILTIADIDFVVWVKSRVKDKKPVFFMMSRMTNTIFKSNFGVGIMFYNRTFTNTTAYFIFASSAGVEYKDMAL